MSGRILLALAVAAAAVAAFGRPAPAVVGGTRIQVQSAPWAVQIRQATAAGVLSCSGAVLDALHVLTAAHCVYDVSGNQAVPSALSIRAGISNAAAPLTGDEEQDRGVSSLRVHSGYTPGRSVSTDDVAVLALAAPLDLGGPAVQPLALPVPGAPFPGRAVAGVAGFGREAVGAAADGSLNWLTATIDPQGTCGGAASALMPAAGAVALCASSAAGSVCNGDSGSALVPEGTRTVIGVATAGPGSCAPGSRGLFAYVAAPEILLFIQGDDHPPLAPRAGPATYVQLDWLGPLQAGNVVTCDSGGWGVDARLTYVFENNATGQVLQQGGRTYALGARDVGATLTCTVFAANNGGTAVLTSAATPAVAAPPPIKIAPLPRATAAPGAPFDLVVVLRTRRSVTGKLGVCVTPPPRVARRKCTSAVENDASGLLPFKIRLRVRSAAPLGPARLAVTAAAGASRAEASAVLRVVRG